ncbi:MAG: hypothetical protein QOF25_1656 [Mycobacterium sp.]|nr:hypothetical protein [Mycobacterium sp.]
MTLITRAVPRALILAAVSVTAFFAGTAPPWAHVEVDANTAVRGGEAILTFQVPNESDKGALTTQFSVALPNLASASTELMPGWTAKLDRDTAAGTTRLVTWTAAPGVGVAPDQFALFRVAVTLPNTDTVSFPATQTYSDATVVHWDQPPQPGGEEPEYPVPMLTLTAAPAEGAGKTRSPSVSVSPAPVPAQASSRPASDNTARWLAGGALLVGAVGVGLAVLVMRRRS